MYIGRECKCSLGGNLTANLRFEDALQMIAALGSLFNKIPVTNWLNGTSKTRRELSWFIPEYVKWCVWWNKRI